MRDLKPLPLSLILTLVFMPLPAVAEETGQISDAIASGPESSQDEDATFAFNNTDIRDVLQLIAEEYSLNMVMSDDVVGTVTLRLKGASLENTLDAILAGRGYDYEIVDNIIRVGKAEAIQNERVQRASRQGQEPLITEVIVLKYLDGNDVKDLVKSMLSPRGTVAVLERRPYRGFRFGTQGSTNASNSAGGTGGMGGMSGAMGGAIGAGGAGGAGGGNYGDLVRPRENETPRSNTLTIVDTRTQVDKIRETIAKLDVQPRQIMIDARIIEVSTRTLEDLGLDFNGNAKVGGSENSILTDVNSGASNTGISTNVLSNAFPSASDAGIHTVFTKLRGEDMQLILHALSQDSKTKTLSSPKILTIENQEAAILVGEQFPIFQSSISDQGTSTESLSYYQPIGISLQVIAQVTPDNEISMIVHPTVSSIGAFVTGTSGLTQPRINTREADTRVLIKNGETLVIGGLLQDSDSDAYYSVPVLAQLPGIGRLFSRKQDSIEQRNLLIFITPRLMKPGDKENLTSSERMTFKGTSEPGRFGYLYERKRAIDKMYESGKKNFKEKRFEAAKADFLRVLALDQENRGAISYLEKMNALPAEKPLS